ncbi:MAG: hypothetical protein ACKVQW_01010 [Pyrinomonadaceae bacterium]
MNENDVLHPSALSFYRYFTEKGFTLKLSTISIAEYCVRGQLDELPLRNLEIIPFNSNHAVQAGEYARIVFEEKSNDGLDVSTRLIIPNDTKLFAQAKVDPDVTHFATSDVESIKIYNLLSRKSSVDFQIINIRESLSSQLGTLPFQD